ncbi:hypothetical protein RB653_005726 [Dictyostelium firmibasis]|uniref:Uncharacterized protein n=1 Tax=Dictyostelium firmibasis TaxID=79012 RepID=A0AAN7YT73_9MYCE
MFFRYGSIARYKNYRKLLERNRREINRRNRIAIQERQIEAIRNSKISDLICDFHLNGSTSNGIILIDRFNSINEINNHPDAISTYETFDKIQSPFHRVLKKIFVVSFNSYFSLPVNVEDHDLKLIKPTNSGDPQFQFQIKVLPLEEKENWENNPPQIQIIINDKRITILNHNPIDVSQIIKNNNDFTMYSPGIKGLLLFQIVEQNYFMSPTILN